MKNVLSIFFLLLVMQLSAQPLSQQLGETAMKIWPDSFVLEGDKVAKWRYDQGVILKGIEGIWKATGEGKWFNYIQKSMDFYVKDDGTIKGYRPDEYNIDHINNGKLLLLLYRVTGKEKYRKAAAILRGQLRTHPRTSEGGFWHKKIYPNQMWLDGLYMGTPFYAEYAKVFSEDSAFNDIAKQFILMETHARDPKTGLLYHGWDESRQQKWADKNTGLSPNIWGRALGWFGMAMVDALDYFPENHPGKNSIVTILNRFAHAITKVQDAKTGLWYDIPNIPQEPKNYFEASASSMLVYAIAKGVRKGYLPAFYLNTAKKGYEGIKKQFIKNEGGQTNLHGTVAVSGLGGNPYRDGSFEYYMSEPVIVNDPKGMGAFINAAVEMEMVNTLNIGKGKRVLLDNFFNNEWKKDATGINARWHYTWDDKSNGGFALLGDVFNRYGVRTNTLQAAPTIQNLSAANIYIIVDPDTEKETEKPNFISAAHASTIANWVKAGGVLVLLGNDAGNTDLKGLNNIASKFGFRFNEDNFNLVAGNNFEEGAVHIPAQHLIFKAAKKLYVKELATIDVLNSANRQLTKDGKNIIAVAKYGKGKVFAIGDPWLYNEYVDGRKLPADFDNYKAAEDLVKWLINPDHRSASEGRSQKSEIKTQNEEVRNLKSEVGSHKSETTTNQLPITNRINVDQSGKGNFKSIQAALNSLPDSSVTPWVVYIKNGIYKEKIYIEKHNIILLGENREKTIITQAIARDEWRCMHNDDWGVATVNVDGDDITLQNLTVINSFGFDWRKETIIPCATDTLTHSKSLTKSSHQMALRTMNGNRLRAINCHFKAFGGDTVSPWDVQNGMFYFKDCIMEGGVDFYCPRGWAWAENCHFISHSGTAAIWHDGSRNPDSKTVLKNCSFEGFDGFNLGRYHRDAQFYLINCTFPKNMADRDIYLVPTANTILWGKRIYYYNCHRNGGDYEWHKDNLQTAIGSPSAEHITVDWLFDGRWKPNANGNIFTPKAHATLKKKLGSHYSNILTQEIMPVNHPANDFTKTPVPYYQTEGPAWENDKVAFRLYLDERNAKDIFGKTTSAMVMDTVGTYGDKYYHYFEPRWGMDVLKVGKSLGAGSLALQVPSLGKDTLIRLGGPSVERISYELVKDGMDEAIIRLHYKNWKVLDRIYNVMEEISIKAGNYFYESSVNIDGLRGDEKLVTGIVNLKSQRKYTFLHNNTDILYTHDKQSENNDFLGMAVMVDKKFESIFGETPKEGNGILSTYTLAMKPLNKQPIVFRFYAGWEKTEKRLADQKYFEQMLREEAIKWKDRSKKGSDKKHR